MDRFPNVPSAGDNICFSSSYTTSFFSVRALFSYVPQVTKRTPRRPALPYQRTKKAQLRPAISKRHDLCCAFDLQTQCSAHQGGPHLFAGPLPDSAENPKSPAILQAIIVPRLLAAQLSDTIPKNTKLYSQMPAPPASTSVCRAAWI